MQKFASNLIGASVFVFQERYSVGKVIKVVVNEHNLNIELLEVDIPKSQKHYILTKDIKSTLDSLVIVESLQDLSESEDLIRQEELIKTGFSLIGAKIKTQEGKYIGKVKDFTIDYNSLKTLKLHATASLRRRILNERYIIDIKDVIEVKNKAVIIKNTKLKAGQKATKALPASSA
jgi:sporulation protein YlmC with PRC-barrel domain